MLFEGSTIPPSPAAESQTILPTTHWIQTQDKEVQWRWCWRCGGGWICQKRLCWRTGSREGSPHTLLLCWSKREKKTTSRRSQNVLLLEQKTLQDSLFIPRRLLLPFSFLFSLLYAAPIHISPLLSTFQQQWPFRPLLPSTCLQCSNLTGWLGYDCFSISIVAFLLLLDRLTNLFAESEFSVTAQASDWQSKNHRSDFIFHI